MHDRPTHKGNPFTTNVQKTTLKFRIKSDRYNTYTLHYSRDLTQVRNFRKQMNEVFSTCILLIKVQSSRYKITKKCAF